MPVCPFVLTYRYRTTDGWVLAQCDCVIPADHIGPHVAPNWGRVVNSAPEGFIGKWIKRCLMGREGATWPVV